MNHQTEKKQGMPKGGLFDQAKPKEKLPKCAADCGTPGTRLERGCDDCDMIEESPKGAAKPAPKCGGDCGKCKHAECVG